MKLFFHSLALIIITATLSGITITVLGQVPTPSESNLTGGIQISLAQTVGALLVTPNLLNKQSHISWAYLAPANSNIGNLSWHDVSFSLVDSTYASIAGLVNNPGGAGNQFYIIYQDGTVALSSASTSGVSAPVVLGRDTNYTQFAYTKLAGKSTLYMLMNNGMIDLSHDGGQSWQLDTAGAPVNAFTALALDTFENAYGFYTPGATTKLYKQRAGTNTWSPISSPAGQLSTALFIDRHNRFFISTYGNGVYYSTDTGNTWTQSTTSINGARGGAMADDAFGNLYLIANGGAQLYRSVDTGANWTEIGHPIATNEVDSNFINVVNSISGDTVLTAFTEYGVFISTDHGDNWNVINTGLHETQFNGFVKSASGRLVESSNNGLFYKDPQAGAFTHPLPANGFGYAGPILADTLGNIYTTTQNGFISGTTKFYWKSSDNGTSWQPDTSGVLQIRNPGSFGVDEYGNEHMSAHGNFGVQLMYKKTLGGNSYVLDTLGLHIRPDFFYNIEAIASDDNGRLFIGGGGDASLLTCWSRPINGANWAVDTAGLGGFATITCFTREANHNMIALAGQGLYYHQNSIWNVIPLPTAPNGGYLAVNAVAADNSAGIIASFTYSPPSFVYSYGYGIYCTHDHGTTWTPVGLTGVNVYGLYNFGDTTYALSDLGIYALTCNGIDGNPLGIAETESASKGASFILYPNPASGICHAVIAGPAPSSKTEMMIMDVSGRTIKNISMEPDVHEVSFNMGDMNGGIYFCALKSGDSVIAVKKLIVTK